MELEDLPASRVDAGDLRNRVEVVYARVHTDFVEHGYTCFFGGGVERVHRGRDVACCYDVGAAFDGGGYDGGVVGVGEERDDEVVRGDVGVESGGVGGYVEGEGFHVAELSS